MEFVEKKKIFGIGVSGLVGSRILELLSDTYNFTPLSLENGIDITQAQTLDVIKKDSVHPFVILLAAKADVDGCEKDKLFGVNGDAWKINVEGVQNVVEACLKNKKKLIYISTDFVFDGDKEMGSSYDETDSPNPINWYGATKYKGEQLVESSGLPYLILRLAYPYRSKFELKKDFVRTILSKLQNNEEIHAVTNHIITPTFIDDIAPCIDVLIRHNTSGIYHVVGSQFVSPYEAAIRVAQTFGYDSTLIQKTTRQEYFKNRAPRPFNLCLRNDEIRRLGIRMRSFDDGLEEIKKQMHLL